MPVGPVLAAPAVVQTSPPPGPTRPSSGAGLFAASARPTSRGLPSPPPSALAREALVSIERAQRRLDAVLEAARRGRTFTAAELLALQAQAYRCSQTLDVASRAVEQMAQGVKQAVNTQV